MSADQPINPMQDPDRTMLMPAPGGRRTPSSGAPPAPASPPPGQPRAATTGPATLHGEGLNPLVRAANPLLDLVTPLRHMATHPDVESLRMQLVQAIKGFEASAKAAQVQHDQIAAARYALCTLLDETISSTPWGGGGVWASRSLLVAFHNEAFGGEKFFLILQKLSQDPKNNLPALELMYLCLALGLEGRYRVIDNGRSQLEQLRERLQGLIAQQHAPAETELSVHWKGASGKGEPLWRMVPVWILAAVAAGLLVLLHMFFGYRLGNASDPVFASLLSLKTAQAPVAPPPKPGPARIAGFLAPEVAQGLVTVVETADRSVVTLRGDGVFGSGSGEVSSAYLPLLARIGEALKAVPGKVIVVGHTDNTRPGLSARFPSNYELSKARATAVRDLLAERAGPEDRYSVEGRGDSAPLVNNDSPANRARNRRVEITLLMPSTAP
ncbi:type IVB secretion system protein IcmH/DotU [Massilia sp. 9I]|uniref:type IVB secretion system protein IcmH/DotU n=1 Tax=Massilia sp. 9I TaxID=2653152 RepID=UPI0012EF9345|nr:type IVB secretion system protein IcmH/DotU [Massilia sp. 9I]VXB63756.1 Outer membrane protein ImpK/VasF, OmpA/MotB domain [Massilia sp. 9I]